MTYIAPDKLKDLARRLALALADEVAFAGDDAAEASLFVLEEARDLLEMQNDFGAVDTLMPWTKRETSD